MSAPELMTEGEAVRRATALASNGYSLLPMDEPDKGLKGIVAFRDRGDGTEDSVSLQWSMFPVVLEKREAKVTPQEFIDFWKGGGVSVCDNPMKRQLGLVRYDVASKTALVRYCPLAAFKDFGRPERQIFLDWRTDQMKPRDPCEQRIVEVQAIESAGRTQDGT